MRIGIIGGTFNPVHLAHLRIAEEVRDHFGLAEVIFIPAATPPHKLLAGEPSFAERCEMVRLAIGDNPLFTLSTIEGERQGKSYSIDTLQALHRERAVDELFFIVGSDSYLEIGSWHRFAAIFSCCNMVVVERPGMTIPDLAAKLPSSVASDFVSFPAEHRLAHSSGYSVYYRQGLPLEISSSAIRGLARQGRSLKYLVPATVEQYIKEQRLYTDAHQTAINRP